MLTQIWDQSHYMYDADQLLQTTGLTALSMMHAPYDASVVVVFSLKKLTRLKCFR